MRFVKNTHKKRPLIFKSLSLVALLFILTAVSLKIFWGYSIFSLIYNPSLKKLPLIELVTNPEDYKSLVSSNIKSIPVKILNKNKQISGELELKKDQFSTLDHGWSFVVTITNSKDYNGLRKFTLESARYNKSLLQWLLHKFYEYENIIQPHFEFVELMINNNEEGKYVLKEDIEDLFARNNKFKNGFIVIYDEGLVWPDQKNHQDTSLPENTGKAPTIHAINPQLKNNEPGLNQQYYMVRNNIEKWRSGEISITNVFDSKKLATLFALLDLFGADPSILYSNLKLYYNPKTRLLEPLAPDFTGINNNKQLIGEKLANVSTDSPQVLNPFYVWNDKNFSEEYLRQLQRLSTPSYLNIILKKAENEFKKYLAGLTRTDPHFLLSLNRLKNNVSLIHEKLSPGNTLTAYYNGASEKNIQLDIINNHSLPVQITNLSVDNQVLSKTDIILSPEANPASVKNYTFEFPLIKNTTFSLNTLSKLTIHYKIAGTSIENTETIIPWTYKPEKTASLFNRIFAGKL